MGALPTKKLFSSMAYADSTTILASKGNWWCLASNPTFIELFTRANDMYSLVILRKMQRSNFRGVTRMRTDMES